MFATRVLEGQTAIVTGGGTGIGLGIARALGKLGATVVAGEPESGASGCRRRRTAPGWIDARSRCRWTCAIRPPWTRWWRRSCKQTGRIDILVNNAAGNFICRAEDLSPNGWNAVIGIVLNGSFYCSRAVGRHMIARGGGGSIVSILANYAWTGSAGTIHSASAKAGVMAMTQTLAVEWAPHRIRVNAIAPGPIESTGAAQQLWSSEAAVKTITDGVPLGRWGRTEEIGDAVSFLVSPHASYITGEVLTVDGGQWLNRGTYNFLTLPTVVTGQFHHGPITEDRRPRPEHQRMGLLPVHAKGDPRRPHGQSVSRGRPAGRVRRNQAPRYFRTSTRRRSSSTRANSSRPRAAATSTRAGPNSSSTRSGASCRIATRPTDSGKRTASAARRRPVDEMWAELTARIDSVQDPQLRALLSSIVTRHADRLRVWPAARNVHHAYRSGLLEHILQIMKVSLFLADEYGARRDLLIAGALLHDIGKLRELSYDTATDYTVEGNLVGHIVIGVGMLRDAVREQPGVPAELVTELEHLILSHHGALELGSPVVPKTRRGVPAGGRRRSGCEAAPGARQHLDGGRLAGPLHVDAQAAGSLPAQAAGVVTAVTPAARPR